MRIIDRPTGSSMIEVVIATLLSGVVVVGALQVAGSAIRTRVAVSTHAEGPMLANELLAEIMAQPYADRKAPGTGDLSGIGRENGETVRTTFNDVDDYLNYSESPPKDSNGVVMSQYTGWRREVNGAYASVTDTDVWAFDSGLKKITVTVTAPNGKVTERVGIRYQDGALEQVASVDSEIVTWVGVQLQLGTTRPARAGTSIINTATD